MTSWTTRQAAEKCGLTEHTVRWYERIGLLDTEIGLYRRHVPAQG